MHILCVLIYKVNLKLVDFESYVSPRDSLIHLPPTFQEIRMLLAAFYTHSLN